MFTALFLICNMNTGACFPHTDQRLIFDNEETCEFIAQNSVAEAYIRIDDPAALVLYKCVSWGTPS